MKLTQEMIKKHNEIPSLKNVLLSMGGYARADESEDTVPRILSEKWLVNNIHHEKKLSSRFNTLSDELRPVLINFFNMAASSTDREMLLLLDNFIETGTTQNIAEQTINSLEKERAVLTVNKYVSENVIGGLERDFYIKLATKSFDATIEILEADRLKKIEVDSLLILSDDELYFSDDKLERLKALSPAQFKLRFKKIFGIEYKN